MSPVYFQYHCHYKIIGERLASRIHITAQPLRALMAKMDTRAAHAFVILLLVSSEVISFVVTHEVASPLPPDGFSTLPTEIAGKSSVKYSGHQHHFELIFIFVLMSWLSGQVTGVNDHEEKAIFGSPNTLIRPPRLPPCMSRAC
jgi:hypothetical protein